MGISSETKVYGLIGHPVSKSLSPQIHNASFQINNIDARYLVFDVGEDKLEDALSGIKALGIKGINVTIPHKISIIKFLDEIDEEAEKLGAVNTVVNINNKLIGFNTDGSGFMRMLADNSVDVIGKKVLILGAGGAAYSIAMSLADNKVGTLHVANRTEDKGVKLVNKIKESFKNPLVDYISLENKYLQNNNYDLVINCTSVGMYPNIDEIPINPSILRKDAIIVDIVYKPLETKFIKYANLNGCRTIGGLDMLIHQALLSQAKWINTKTTDNMIFNRVKERIMKTLVE